MLAAKIMLIRRGEKPDNTSGISGVNLSGAQNEHELSVPGWQRAGALIDLFSPRNGGAGGDLATPGAIFATAMTPDSRSLRPQHTVEPLANRLELALNTDHPEGEEEALVAKASVTAGNVLICWHHEAIPKIANLILGNATTCPQHWPHKRFDVVWVFDKPPGAAAWRFSQVPQLLLKGDRTDTIKATDPA